MFYIIQSTIAHEFALIDFTIFTKLQENVLPDKYSVTVFMNHNESIGHGIVCFPVKTFVLFKDFEGFLRYNHAAAAVVVDT